MEFLAFSLFALLSNASYEATDQIISTVSDVADIIIIPSLLILWNKKNYLNVILQLPNLMLIIF